MSLLRRIEKAGQAPTGGAQPPTAPDATRNDDLQLKRRQAPAPVHDAYAELKTRVQQKIIADLDPKLDLSKQEQVRRTIEGMFNDFLAQEDIVLARTDKARLFDDILAEVLGFGPIQKLLEDPTIDEIMINGPRNIYIERQGKIVRVPIAFDTDSHVYRIIDRIVSPLGRRVDEGQPYVDARLPDGSRVNIIIPPL